LPLEPAEVPPFQVLDGKGEGVQPFEAGRQSLDAGKRLIGPELPSDDDAADQVPLPEPLPGKVLDDEPEAAEPGDRNVRLGEVLLCDRLLDAGHRIVICHIPVHVNREKLL
jgi:hypothetical protein